MSSAVLDIRGLLKVKFLFAIADVCCLVSLIQFHFRRDLMRQPDIDENI